MSGKIEHEPIAGSSPNLPQRSNQVGTRAPKPPNQVASTISAKYFRLYNLNNIEILILQFFAVIIDKSCEVYSYNTVNILRENL